MATEAPPSRGRAKRDAAFNAKEKPTDIVTCYYTKGAEEDNRSRQADYASKGYECEDEGWRLKFTTTRENRDRIQAELHNEAIKRSSGGRIGRTEKSAGRDGVGVIQILERDIDVRGMEPKGLDEEVSNDDLLGSFD